MRISPEEFETLVEKALDGLPEEFAMLLDNVVVVVEDEPSDDLLRSMEMEPGEEELLGLYQGVALHERGWEYTALPDQVSIFRGPILRVSRTRRDVLREVRETVMHELGHHFGLDEEDMPF
jgi:predicted Zn-dependent protease with MMP-like domain